MVNQLDTELCPHCGTQNISLHLVGKQYCFLCSKCEHEYLGEILVGEQLIAETIFQKLRPLHVAQMAEIKKLTTTEE